MGEVGKATLVLDGDTTGLARAGTAAQRTLGSLESIGIAVTKSVGVAFAGVAAGTGLAIKAASDFESSFAGVRKTVSATELQFAELAAGMRGLSREIPVNVNELNRIGEAAGQLGIRTENILDFTETMAQLGVTTNLSADAAATSLARLANITGLPQSRFDQLGSTIVALGNNFATTEADIVEFGLRMAGAGEIAGLSEAEILGIGAAMSSVGVEAEAGGTAVQKVLLGITQAVSTGNSQLGTFATTAGMSAQQFATAWRQDAAGAFTAFVEGLGAQGNEAFQTLEALELQDQRLIRSFLSLAGAGDLLAETMQTGNVAFEENTALAAEAAQRFGTFASQLTLLKNDLQDIAIDIGQKMLPVVRELVTIFREFIAREGQGLVDLFAQSVPDAINVTLTAVDYLGKGFAAVFVGVQTVIKGISGLFQGLVAVVATATVKMADHALETMDVFRDWFDVIDDNATKLEGLRDSAQELADAGFAAAEDNLRSLGDDIEWSTGLTDEFSAKIEELRERLLAAAGKSGAAALSEEVDKMSASFDAGTNAIEEMNARGMSFDEWTNGAVTSGTQASRVIDGMATSWAQNANKVDVWAGAIAQGALELRDLDGALLDADSAAGNFFDRINTGVPLLDGLAAGLSEVWNGMTNGDGLSGFLTNIGSGIAEGFGQMLSGAIADMTAKLTSALTSVFASAFGGGSAAQTGSSIGSGIGGMVGMIWGPVGSMIGTALGGLLGSAIGSMFEKANVKDHVAEHLGVEISEGVAQAAEDLRGQFGGDIEAAFRSILSQAISEASISSMSDLQHWVKLVHETLSSVDEGAMTSAQAIDAMGASWQALIPHLQEVGGSAMMLQGQFSDLITRFGATPEVVAQITAALQAMEDAGVAGVGNLVDWLSTLGVEIEGIAGQAERVEIAFSDWQAAVVTVTDLKAQMDGLRWATVQAQQAADAVGQGIIDLAGGATQSLSSIRDHWRAMAEAGVISWSDAQQFMRHELTTTKNAVMDAFREQARAAGFHGDDVDRVAKDLYQSWRKEVRETEREAKRAARDQAREARQELRAEIRDAREAAKQKKQAWRDLERALTGNGGIFDDIGKGWSETINQMIADGERFFDVMVGNSVFPDVATGAIEAADAISGRWESMFGDMDASSRPLVPKGGFAAAGVVSTSAPAVLGRSELSPSRAGAADLSILEKRLDQIARRIPDAVANAVVHKQQGAR